MNTWFKFYGLEYLADSKIESLTAQERSVWVTLLCLASATPDGVVRFITVETLLRKSGIIFDPYHSEEWDNNLGVLKKFERLEMVGLSDEGHVTVKNWQKRQSRAMTVTERVNKYRNKATLQKRVTDVTICNETANDRIDKIRIDKTREDKKREENTEENTVPKGTPTKAQAKKFVKPTVEEVQAYCTERGNRVDAHKFIDFYDSKGWLIGRNPMKDWKASVRTWEQRDSARQAYTPTIVAPPGKYANVKVHVLGQTKPPF